MSGPSGSGKDAVVKHIKELLEGKTILKTDELINQEKYRLWFFSPENNLFSKDTILYLDRLELYQPEIIRIVTEIIEYGEFFLDEKKIKIESKVIISTETHFSDENLLHHIQPFNIKLKPLSERKDEIPLLLSFFLTKYNNEYNKNIHLGRETLHFLTDYPFPGNIRELKNLVKILVTLKNGSETINIDDMPGWIYDTINNSDTKGFIAGLSLVEHEKRIIKKTLEITGGNRLKASEMLGISERNLYRKIKTL